MQHATTNVQNVHRTRPFGAIEIHGKGISTRLKTLETALKSLALIYDIPDDSNVLPFIANAAAIFRKLAYKDPNGKKTPCKFKNVRTINATQLPFPTIRELEQMLEERSDIQLTYSTRRYEKANMLSIHSFHTKVLNTKTYNALIPFRHLAKNLEELVALLLTRNGKTYIHAYICTLVTQKMNVDILLADKPTVNETIAENILPYATTNLRTAYKDTPTRIAKVGIVIGSGANECLFVLLCPPVSHTV